MFIHMESCECHNDELEIIEELRNFHFLLETKRSVILIWNTIILIWNTVNLLYGKYALRVRAITF